MTYQVLNIGRAPENEITLDYPMISWRHARITGSVDGWIIEDLNSKNGTALNKIGNKIQQARLQSTDQIYLGSYKIAASEILKENRLTKGSVAFERVRFQGDRMVLGRDPSSSLPLDSPMISWHHAALKRTSEGFFIEDLGSLNGTYVDGARITERTLLRAGQEIGLGSYRFQLLDDGTLARRTYVGNVTIELESVAVNAPDGERLLDPISLTILPSELTALMGPSGAGKTTFLKAINGYSRPAGGRVLFNGDDLYKFYDRFRQQMSYVPQDDIVHPQLTVRESLYFSAKLRTDLTDAEIQQRIKNVLVSVGLKGKENKIIGSPVRQILSGGERKRVNIAMELLSAAPVIFLDEPTSGLSSYDTENVIDVLKNLSREGTTIVTTIHQPSLSIYKLFDTLIMISPGALAYFGPAYPDAIEFFDPAAAQGANGQPPKDLSPEMLLSGLATQTTPEWVAKFEQSRYKQLFVRDRSGKIPAASNSGTESAARKFGLGQWWTLVRRNVILKIRDRGQAIITLAQAPAFAILLGLVFGRLQYSNDGQFEATTINHAVGVEFLMVIAAIWFGCNNVARDIVGEWTVFHRERMVSLKLPSYVFSKLAVAAVINLFQCISLWGIVTAICELKAAFLPALGILYLSSLVGSAIGLCVSARASTTEAAIAMLPLIMLPIITLGGALAPIRELPRGLQQAAKIVPSRWAFEGNLLLEAKQNHFVDHPCSQGEYDTSPDQCSPAETPKYVTPEQRGCDLASHSFPSKPQDGRAPLECEAKPSDPERTPLFFSFAILGGMLAFWVGVALVFLRMRDVH